MRRKERFSKLRSSLLSRYLLIIIAALLFLPVVLPLTIIAYDLFNRMDVEEQPKDAALYSNIKALEKLWHNEALLLQGASPEVINQRLHELSGKYSKATLFWVDGQGMTRLTLEPAESVQGVQRVEGSLPVHWTATEAIAFMKQSMKREPLTIVAFVGDTAESGEGFMVMQIPESVLNVVLGKSISIWYGLVLLVLFIAFAVVSWLFFIGIRKRLLRLQTAMTITGPDGMPGAIASGKPDEIGRLEEAFNTMVAELASSRRRESEEEDLRKRLVSDLSHDLRTPLTIIRSHLHVLTKEKITSQGQESLKLMDERIADLGVLIENLLSYNLLNSGRVILNRERKDILRLLRESAAAWYPLWEKEGFEVDIDLETKPLYWSVDEVWFRRILDNLYQNIVRHARSGCYVGISTEVRAGLRVILITDHGQGLESDSTSKGAGLGLTIVDLLLKAMELDWTMESTQQGTSIVLFNPRREI